MFGSEEQKRKWLEPLLRGEIRSCFCMTGMNTTMSMCFMSQDTVPYERLDEENMQYSLWSVEI